MAQTQGNRLTIELVESRVRGNPHARFGRRPEETDRPKDRHRASGRPHLANLMLTRVRQRLVHDREHRRGRKIDPAWANRRLLLRGYDTLSSQARARLEAVFATDDPTDELSAAWGIKEQLRRLLKVQTVEQARHQKMILGCYVLAADLEESWR